MPRLRQVPRDEVNTPIIASMYDYLFADRDPITEPGTTSGTPGDWWTVFAAVPDVFEHAVQGIGVYRSPRRLLDPTLRELGQTRAGWSVGSRFVFSQHCKACRLLGMSEEKITAIAYWQTSDLFDEAERAVLAYTDALALQGGRMHDALFDALRAHLSNEEILELTYLTSLYIMHAIMSRALRTEWDDVDDPTVEIDGPDDFKGYEFAAEPRPTDPREGR